ncbi:MAG: HAMP domain-containing histidine kinase [candidate division KSB1 bacterium]|nr:HAMP domain-containing histidine kinase [candidate division KSB1 bacterium]MDZ7364626.1 HAMP domain-containing histidine kinase [candidate division KSB1 bacterium]MDZ7402626.1 HAMP domain-containing histidine kinase [candidate division KSB1 bacterium]
MEPRKISLGASLDTLPVRLRNLLATPLRHSSKVAAAVPQEGPLDPPTQPKTKKTKKSLWKRRDRMRARLSEAEKQARELEERNRLQAEFIADVSHEFRTPLNGILGYTELLRDGLYGEMAPAQLEVLNHIRDCGHHLVDLVNEVLDLSRLKKHQVQLELESVLPVELIEAAAAAVQPLAKRKRLDLLTNCQADLPMLRVDFRRIYQVLLNLLSNAIKFTHEGSVEIGARRDGKKVRFHVKDTGIGIAPEFARHVFKDFRQSDGAVRPFGGVGLGLSLSKRLVELHGGKIGYTTKQNEGTEFYFFIPY